MPLPCGRGHNKHMTHAWLNRRRWKCNLSGDMITMVIARRDVGEIIWQPSITSLLLHLKRDVYNSVRRLTLCRRSTATNRRSLTQELYSAMSTYWVHNMTSLYRQKRLEDCTYWRSSAETASSTNVDVSTVDISLSRIVCQARSQGWGIGAVGRPPRRQTVTLPPTVRVLTSWVSSVYENRVDLPCRFEILPQSTRPDSQLGTPIFKPWKWSNIIMRNTTSPVISSLRACLSVCKAVTQMG